MSFLHKTTPTSIKLFLWWHYYWFFRIRIRVWEEEWVRMVGGRREEKCDIIYCLVHYLVSCKKGFVCLWPFLFCSTFITGILYTLYIITIMYMIIICPQERIMKTPMEFSLCAPNVHHYIHMHGRCSTKSLMVYWLVITKISYSNDY